MNSKNFFAELKRRNVYKVAIAYAVVGWLLIQIATQVFPFFEIPNWAVRLVVLLIAIGFPIALILAWAFELTPEGIKRTEDLTPDESPPRRGRRGRLITATIVTLALIALGLTIYQVKKTSGLAGQATPAQPQSARLRPGSLPVPEKSVAVLPFENLSEEKANAFFAQGVQDEIITALSKISGLRVISRTSTANYKSKPESLSGIARDLRVSHVVEGSVQKSGDRVHINVQLIQGETDAHLWAQSYDRQLTDIFSVEAEVAKTIADSLRATLSPQEKARVESKPTSNADAYVLYLRARQYQTRPDTLLQDYQAAARLYEQAIDLDSNFALAHARLSATTSSIYHWFEPTETVKRKAYGEASEALGLQPGLGEGHLALGLYFYYEEADYDYALRQFNLAARALPNDGDVSLYIAAVQRRQGRLKDCIAAYQRAETMDPRNPVILYDASQTYFLLRDWPATVQGLDRVIALSPDSPTVKIERAYTEFYWKGSTAPIKATLGKIPADIDPDGTVTFARWDVSLLDRDAAAATKAVASCPLEMITTADGAPVPKIYLQACTELARGDISQAHADFEAARPTLEMTVRKSPDDAARHAHLGLLYAFMGRKEDALREGRRAVELKPTSRDAVDGPLIEAFQCLIFARLGMADEAIPLIERILIRPGAVDYANDSITLADLRTRWEWDPIRSDPRFQKIVAGTEPKTVYK